MYAAKDTYFNSSQVTYSLYILRFTLTASIVIINKYYIKNFR